MDTDKSMTILDKRKGNRVKFGKEELLLLLTSYEKDPSSWPRIIENMQKSLDKLPKAAQTMYKNASLKQIKDRLSNKFWKLISTPAKDFDDEEIRNKIEALQAMEKRNIATKTTSKVCDTADNVQAGPSHQAQNKDARSNIVDAMSSSDDECEMPTPEKKKKVAKKTNVVKKSKRKTTMELIRKNQLLYHKFITKSVPKILAEFGIKESDSEDSE